MEGIKIEVDFSSEKIKDKWHQFLIRKYKNEKSIPRETNGEDFKEFIKETESEIKSGIVDRMYPHASTKEKEEIMKQIIIDFEKIEKPLLSGG